MSKKFAYMLAVLFLLVIRFGVLNTGYDQWLIDHGFTNAGYFISFLKQNTTFNDFFGNWSLVIFVITVMIFWSTGADEQMIPTHFLLLPIAYIPYSIVGAVLTTAEFRFNYLFIHPLIILPVGYLYVIFWKMLFWLCEKLRLIAS